jgi:hypothetical protein
MYIPSRPCWDELHGSQAGLWLDRARDGERIMVAKLPTVVLKVLHRGAMASFIVGVETVGDAAVQCLGFQVDDQPGHPFITVGTNVTTAEQDDFLAFLAGPAVSFICFDELSRCVSRMHCTVADHMAAGEAQAMLTQTAPHYVGNELTIRMDAMDKFEARLNAAYGGRADVASGLRRVNVSIKPERTMSITAVTFDGAGDFALDDATEGAEGSGLEQQIHQLLSRTFGTRLYRSPRVGGDGSRRELTDVLGLSNFGTVLIESKAESVFGVDPHSPPDRRAKRQAAAIEKGLKQLGGAVRRLRAAEPIYRASGEVIPASPEDLKIVQGIVLLSDMNAELDWEKLSNLVVEQSQKHHLFIHIFDLTELRMVVGCGERPDKFHDNLFSRWRFVARTGSGFARTRLPEKPTEAKG